MMSNLPKCVCGNYFDDQDFQPKRLPQCKHVLCIECCFSQYENSKKVTCPQCNKTVERNPAKFQTDKQVELQVEAYYGRCTKEGHDEIKSFYCFEDAELVCCTCQDDSQHEGHRIVNVLTATQEIKQTQVSDNLKFLQDLLETSEENISFYKDEEKRVKELAQNVHNQIKKEAEELVKMILKKANAQQENLEKETNVILTNLREKIAKFSGFQQKIDKRLSMQREELVGMMKFIAKSQKLLEKIQVEDKQELKHEVKVIPNASFEAEVLPNLMNLEWSVPEIPKRSRQNETHFVIIKNKSNKMLTWNLAAKEKEEKQANWTTDDETHVTMIDTSTLLLTGGYNKEQQLVVLGQDLVEEKEMINGRRWHGVAYNNHMAYITGGLDRSECESYNTQTGASKSLPSLPHELYSHGTTLAEDNVFTFGGRKDFSSSQSCIYQLVSSSWVKKTEELPKPADEIKATYISNRQACLIHSLYTELGNTLLYDFSQTCTVGPDFPDQNGMLYYNAMLYQGNVYDIHNESFDLYCFDWEKKDWVQC